MAKITLTEQQVAEQIMALNIAPRAVKESLDIVLGVSNEANVSG